MSSVPTIASGALRKLFTMLKEQGVDADAVRAEASLEQAAIDDADGRIPVAQLHAAWDAAFRRLPRGDAALLAAEMYNPGDYGLVGFVAMTASNLRESMAHVIRYIGLWTDDPGFTLGDDGALRFRYRHFFPDSPGLRLANEAGFAEFLHASRLVTQKRLAPQEVRFTHAALGPTAAHEEFFRCPVHFEAKENAMLLGAEALDLPVPKADAQLGAFLQASANDALARRGSASGPLQRIREIIGEELQRGVPALEQIARRLGTSERTLRRRLEDEGTSFRAILDETRAELARGYVREGRASLAEVAFLVGFSETSAFNRAFKRWTGAPPSTWRAQERARTQA